MSTDNPDHDSSTTTGGFAFGPDTHNHEVEIAYSWRYTDRLVLDGQQIQRISDGDGCYGGEEEYSCTCGAEFETESEAEQHLQRVQRNQPPLPAVPSSVEWIDEGMIHGIVPTKLSTWNTIGRVTSQQGVEYLVATAREQYTPPANFAFETWEPLLEGRLTYRDGSPLFKPKTLKRALNTLVSGLDYRPERYTLHFRGYAPLFLEGNGGRLVVAPAPEYVWDSRHQSDNQ